MRSHRWAVLAAWALLGWGFAARSGFAFSFLFYTYSLIAAYGFAVRWFGLAGVRVSRTVRSSDGRETFDGAFEAGDEAIVEVTLRRPFALPLPWLVVRERVGEAEHDLFFGAWWSTRATYRYALPLPRRGVFAFEPAELWAGDPFGLVQHRSRARSAPQDVAVAPRPRRYGYDVDRALLALGAGRQGRLRREGDEPADSRPYRDGDSLSRVLWKLAARTDEWRVRREAAPAGAEETAIVVDASGASAADLDACAEAAAGAAVALGARRRAFRLYAGGAAGFGSAPAAAGDWRRRLAALAMATNASAEGAAMPPAGLNAAGAHLSRAGAVVVVADALRPETAALCRTCAAGGRDVLLLLAKRTAIGERSSATAAPGAPSPASASPASASPASASRASESRASAGGAPGEPAPDALLSWLLRRGVRVASLDDDGERLLVEGGGADGSTRAVPS